MERMMPRARISTVIVTVIGICFAVWAILFIRESSFVTIDGDRSFSLFDDAMISMRYAWNFSHGYGLVYNPGERVEGYTNLLMTLFMSLATLLLDKRCAVLFVQVSGILLMLGIAYLSMTIADHVCARERLGHRDLLRTLCFAWPLMYYPLAYWTLLGMETGLLTLLLLAGVYFGLRYAGSRRPLWLYLASTMLGLAYLTRPDSAVFAAIVYGYVLFETAVAKPARAERATMLAGIGLFVLFPAAQMVFRLAYYGEWLPNTYVLKVAGFPVLDRIRNGLGFIGPYLGSVSFVLLVVGVGLVREWRSWKLFLASFAVAAVGYQIWAGGDPWPYWRIMAPAMPLLSIVFVYEMIRIAEAAGSLFRTRALRRGLLEVLAVILLSLTGWIALSARFVPEVFMRRLPYHVEYHKAMVDTALALDQTTSEDAVVGVIWAGIIPYYTERKAIDFLGKTDKHIARLPPYLVGAFSRDGMFSVPGHNKHDLNYSIQVLLPTYVQDFRWGPQDLWSWAPSRYATMEYKGVSLNLLKDSPDVFWDRLDEPE
jgi:arabinofuranosyltransferase